MTKATTLKKTYTRPSPPLPSHTVAGMNMEKNPAHNVEEVALEDVESKLTLTETNQELVEDLERYATYVSLTSTLQRYLRHSPHLFLLGDHLRF